MKPNPLRVVRKKNHVTLQTMANDIDVAISSVSAWEKGSRIAKYHFVRLIEDYFEVKKFALVEAYYTWVDEYEAQ